MEASAITKNLQKLGAWRLKELKGFNGSFATYTAADQGGRAAAVVAVIQNQQRSPGSWEACCRELAEITARPPAGIAAPLAFGHDSAHYWVAYEWLDGCHLGENVRNNGLPPVHEAFEVMALVTEAIGRLQSSGVILRILNPASIFLTNDGSVRLLHAAWGHMICGTHHGLLDDNLSSVLPFSAPELVAGKDTDISTDVYSLGANLYFLLTGQPVYWSDDPRQLRDMIVYGVADLKDLREDIGDEGAEVLGEMLAKDPDERPMNFPALANRLRSVAAALEAGPPVLSPAPPPSAPPPPRAPAAPAPPAPPIGAAGYSDNPEETFRVGQSGPPGAPTGERPYTGPSTIEVALPPQGGAPPHQPFQSVAPPYDNSQLPPPPSQQDVVVVLDEQVESAKARRQRILIMSISGGVLVLALFVWAGLTAYQLITRETKPKKEVVGIRGLQAQAKSQVKDVGDYVETADALLDLAMLTQSYNQRNGRWPSAIEDLEELGATDRMFIDAWGTRIDLRESFLISAGKDKEWDNEDDIWYDVALNEPGGYEPEVGLDTDNPLLWGQGNRINDLLQNQADHERTMRRIRD